MNTGVLETTIRALLAPGRGIPAADEYRARIPAKWPFGDYTPRLVPRHPIAAVTLEAPEILWQR